MRSPSPVPRDVSMDALPMHLQSKLMPEPNTGCWIWIAATSKGGRCGGYGSVRDGGRNRQAHRVVWEQFFGPLHLHETLDHVAARGCSTITCCNPAHLEPVSQGENNRRSSCHRHAAFRVRTLPKSMRIGYGIARAWAGAR